MNTGNRGSSLRNPQFNRHLATNHTTRANPNRWPPTVNHHHGPYAKDFRQHFEQCFTQRYNYIVLLNDNINKPFRILPSKKT